MSSQLGAISSVNSLIGRVFKQPRGDFVSSPTPGIWELIQFFQADRLNSLYTVCVLAVSSGRLLTSHFWGTAITCWTPAEFNGIWSDFVNKYCYVHGTYFYSIEEELDFDVEKRQKIFIRYYQWVPYILALQAFLFYIPRLLMRMMCTWSGKWNQKFSIPRLLYLSLHCSSVFNNKSMSEMWEDFRCLVYPFHYGKINWNTFLPWLTKLSRIRSLSHDPIHRWHMASDQVC